MKEKNKSGNIIEYLFDKDYENKTCVHCKSPMPAFASINNAIIICQKCAEMHKTFGYNISYVRELKDDWDPYLLSFFEIGGNSRFIRFLKKYELDDIPIENIFYTKISEYYRLSLKSEVLAEEPPSEIPLESAKDIIYSQEINFPEFENYEIYEGKIIVEKDPGKIVNAFRYVGKGLGSMKTYFEEIDISSKLKSGGEATLNGISKAGSFLYNLTMPVYNYASGKTKEGFGYLYNKIYGNKENNKKEEELTITLNNEIEETDIITQKEDDI